MRRVKVIWTPRSLTGLNYIRERIAEDDPKAAKKFVLQLRKKVGNLRRFPELGGSLKDIEAPPNTREIFHGNYRVIYRFDGKQVHILVVQHSAKPLSPESLSG
ncbi:MAG: type II toxin-antitoxin system RelE/ParE family toxin [Gemmataceae bacterium]|nr:type II toxin-antitoxin system RelE/ParE family toxin [Gemmataceae bacterium]